MMTAPLVSIVVPSLNQAPFIVATLDSILQQDYPQIECIVIDGGSSDETVTILRGYSDARLSWISEPDRGQSDAINKGLRRAQGHILSFLNSDDLLQPGAVQAVVNAFSSHPDAGIVFGDCNFVDVTGKLVSVVKSKPFLLDRALVGDYAITQPGTFWRRDVYEDIGGFNLDLHYVMDIDYWMRAAAANVRFLYLPETLSAFRLHADSKSISAQAKFLDEWQQIIDSIYALPDLPPSYQRLREESHQVVEWAAAKSLWMQQNHRAARPLLRKYLRQNKRGRQLIATTMLIDSYLHTPFTRSVAALFTRLTGQQIFFENGRVI